ncbi:MAG: response regulator [Spirochaetales bacterium]|nr:response regulator [Spirochaetales bacterium]
MLLMTAYLLTKNFNKEHNDLIQLKNTLEKKVEERTKQLRNIYEQKTNFFINLTHETKTPLTLISNYLDKDIKLRGRSNEINIVKHNIDKLKKDMINYLDLEKLERGLIFYNHDQAINLSMILKKKIPLFKEIAEKKRISIVKNIEENLYIKMDPFAIDRVINNLLDNAIKYSKENGKIHVTLSAEKQKVHLTVNDSGIGISRDQQNNIFKSFYQISHEKRNIQGIGMGLNIVKNIMREVKGTINVKSESNAGTTFGLTFDRYALTKKEKARQSHSVSKPFDSVIKIDFKPEVYKKDRKNIFLVEDNPVMASFLQDNLYHDYNVFLAGNGRAALEKLSDIAKPNLIISDIMMDEMNGYEFYDNLMQDKTYSAIPFIFLTAVSSDMEKINALQRGAVDYICKPFDIDELLHKIHSLLRIQESQKKRQLEKISADFSKVLYNEFESNEETSAFAIMCNDYRINKKEQQIIKLLLKGLEYKEISRRLDFTINMVKKRIHTIYRKLGIQNKIELVNRFKT